MLTIRPISSPTAQRRRLQAFDPDTATWVVSDLRSKLDMNRALLNARGFVQGEAVLRASELWRHLLGRLRPEFQIVSREFAIALISERLERDRTREWTRGPGVASAAYEYIAQLMPLLSHPDGAAIVDEWLGKNDAARARWGDWYTLSHELWMGFLEEETLAPPWVAGVLANEPDLAGAWNRPLVFDLGPEITQAEADLIDSLSAAHEVEVLRPAPEWAAEQSRALQPYEIFDRRLEAARSRAPAATAAIEEPVIIDSASAEHAPVYRKLTTMLAEVKEAVAQARVWLDAGVSPTAIAIAAPDIESYWPTLSAYLEAEGIPTTKERVARLHSFPDVARWLASMRLRSGAHSEADLELCLFDGAEAGRAIPFARFRTLFASVYGREDFSRAPEIEALFASDLDEATDLSRDEFLAWAIKQARDDMDSSRLERILRRIYTEAPESTRLAAKRWLSYLGESTARIEVVIREGEASGISVINMNSAESSPSTKMIAMGITESALRSGSETNVLFSDALSISAQYGVYLSHADRARLEFEARWVLGASERELLVTVPETDFAGKAQAPAWLWIQGAARAGSFGEKVGAPRTTRWDEIQRAGLMAVANERGWTEDRRSAVDLSIKQDLMIEPHSTFPLESSVRLSASALESYLKCPFMFAAKKAFRLSDLPDLDLDIDAMTKGKLMHAVFERLVQEPFRADLSDEELGQVVEDARKSSELELADERLWPSLKVRHVELGRRFLEVERDWRAKHPETRTVGVEVPVQGWLDLETGELAPERSAHAIAFSGKIDRVDFDSRGFAAVLDYKSSASPDSVSNFDSWIKKDRLQLLLYAQALERGLTTLTPRPVASAVYYVGRSLNRDLGFKLIDVEQGLYEFADRKKNQATSQQKAEMFEALASKTRDAMAGVLAGRFQPVPKEMKTCDRCEWSDACRAPHLNI